jgi:(S)-2-hydroxyglutarate dehydrogenase
MPESDYLVVGGGIVGLATAMLLGRRKPGARILVLEKEKEIALHQTGRNSGVIHSGIYYTPGSFKARFARAGSRSMVEFCREQGLECVICGKVIVATAPAELAGLEKLLQRGRENELAVEKLVPEQVREIEPHVNCLAGLRVPATGIVNYRQVCLKYAEIIRSQGGEVRTGARVTGLSQRAATLVVQTTAGDFETRYLVNCAGLHSDRVARLAGLEPGARIVPFRGEYYALAPAHRHLVRTLIYPVPNPDFPFLGVHFTRMIDGSVHAGPNAVLAFAREGYHKTDFSLHDSAETLLYPGFWKLAARNLGEGLKEMQRSFSKSLFVRSLQRLVPDVRAEDLVPAEAGIRAQALYPDGRLVDDFLIVQGPNSLHVCNAPSPAATASLEIGKHIVDLCCPT